MALEQQHDGWQGDQAGEQGEQDGGVDEVRSDAVFFGDDSGHDRRGHGGLEDACGVLVMTEAERNGHQKGQGRGQQQAQR